MNNYGSYVKAIRKAFTHLTEEPKKNYNCSKIRDYPTKWRRPGTKVRETGMKSSQPERRS